MDNKPIKNSSRFEVHFDGFAQCSYERNIALTNSVVSATRAILRTHFDQTTGTIVLYNDLANRVMSKLIFQLNRQRRDAADAKFRVLLRDLSHHGAAVSTVVYTGCLIDTINLGSLDREGRSYQTIVMDYQIGGFDFIFSTPQLES